MSVITFNLSVSDKRNMVELAKDKTPYQIIPTTRSYLSPSIIDGYRKSINPNLLIHMNYITRVFNDVAGENDSRQRWSLRHYARLASKLGTRNILIHGPSNEEEMNHFREGMMIIADELIDIDVCELEDSMFTHDESDTSKSYIPKDAYAGIYVHIETPSWSKALIQSRNKSMTREGAHAMIKKYYSDVLDWIKFMPKSAMYIVHDTAHMYANGCDTLEMFNEFFEMTKKHCKFLHLNGNVKTMYTCDKHCPMFDDKNNKIKCWREVSKLVSKMNVMCIAEVTEISSDWNSWTKYAKEYGFKLVKYNDEYSI